MKYGKTIVLILATMVLSGCSNHREETVRKVRAAHYPVALAQINHTYPNSAGGVSLLMWLENTSNKTIKYINYKFTSYNSVGDEAPSEIDGESQKDIKLTGPYAPGDNNFSYAKSAFVWKNVWYNNSISCVELNSVKITYMDGSVVSIDEQTKILGVLPTWYKNNCRVI